MKQLIALLQRTPYRFQAGLGLILLLLMSPFYALPALLESLVTLVDGLRHHYREWAQEVRWFSKRLVKGGPKKDG